jgi:hypothetical protein
VLKLKTPYSDGTSHLFFSGLEFVEKLAAIVPPSRTHLTRFFGCLAPHAKIRSQIVSQKELKKGKLVESTTTGADTKTQTEPKKTRRYGWAELLARVFAIDLEHCTRCGGELKVIAAIIETGAIRKILTHLDLPFRPPHIAPARISTHPLSFA